MTPPEARAVVEAVLGPLSDLPVEEARAHAEALKGLLFSGDASAREQGLALLESCGDWTTLSLLAESLEVSEEGGVKVPLNAPEPGLAWAYWRAAALGGRLAGLKVLRPHPSVATRVRDLPLQLAPRVEAVEVPLDVKDAYEVHELPGALLLLRDTHRMPWRILPDTRVPEEVFPQHPFYGSSHLRTLEGHSLLFAEHGLYVLEPDGQPRALRDAFPAETSVLQVDDRRALLHCSGHWLQELSLVDGTLGTEHPCPDVGLLAALPSGPLLTLTPEQDHRWYRCAGGEGSTVPLPWKARFGGAAGRFVLLVPAEALEELEGAEERPLAVVDVDTGTVRTGSYSGRGRQKLAQLEDGRVAICSDAGTNHPSRIFILSPGMDAPPVELRGGHERGMRTWRFPRPDRIITHAPDGSVLWNSRTGQLIGKTSGRLHVSWNGHLRVQGTDGPSAFSLEDFSPVEYQPPPPGKPWTVGGRQFTNDDDLRVHLTLAEYDAWAAAQRAP